MGACYSNTKQQLVEKATIQTRARSSWIANRIQTEFLANIAEVNVTKTLFKSSTYEAAGADCELIKAHLQRKFPDIHIYVADSHSTGERPRSIVAILDITRSPE